jgi:hypothetical protein
MAVTIVRTNWIDDDGTGTTGTVINNAVKTALYNDIDGALAKVAQLAGGNTFTGTQIMTDISSAAALRLLTGVTERLRLAATGEVLVGSATPLPGYSQAVGLVFGSTTGAGLVAQNVSAANTGNFHVFLNSAGGLAGYIAQSGVTGVIFGTASDQRLKVDGGRASDLTALRAVVIHDFTWKADGVRDRGVFAQEAHALYPRAVTAGTDETTADGAHLTHPWGTDYSKFVPDLIVGWQQHDVEIAALRAFLATLTYARSTP